MTDTNSERHVRPRALDLFCGAGGASMGLYRAGFDVTGVDIKPQPRYPFAFVQADALEYPLEGFDFIWASPPCQADSIASKGVPLHKRSTIRLIAPTRERLEETGTLYVIENVIGSDIGTNSIVLCGLSFALPLIRHRRFESNFGMLAPSHRTHKRGMVLRREVVCVAGWSGHTHGVNFSVSDYKRALDIHWMQRDELRNAIPPAYSEFIGRQAMNLLCVRPPVEGACE